MILILTLFLEVFFILAIITIFMKMKSGFWTAMVVLASLFIFMLLLAGATGV